MQCEFVVTSTICRVVDCFASVSNVILFWNFAQTIIIHSLRRRCSKCRRWRFNRCFLLSFGFYLLSFWNRLILLLHLQYFRYFCCLQCSQRQHRYSIPFKKNFAVIDMFQSDAKIIYTNNVRHLNGFIKLKFVLNSTWFYSSFC